MNKAITDAIKAEEDKAYHKGFADGLQMGGFNPDRDIKLNNKNFFAYVSNKALAYIHFNYIGGEYESGMLKVLNIMLEAAEVLKETDKRVKEMHTDKGCESCKYVENSALESPCVDCMRNHKDMWEAKR